MPDELFALDVFSLACDFAREQNEWVPAERVRGPAASARSDAKGHRPGDDYNRQAEWAAVLEPHGWKVARTSGSVTYWVRPDKSAREGHSATTGRCHTEGRGDLLYVFSSNAAPFEPDTAYSKFAAYVLLNHGGDYTAGTRKLADEGYGWSDPADGLSFPAAPAPSPASPPIPPGSPPPDDGVSPDFDFATNADLRRLDLGITWVWDKWLQCKAVNLLAAEGGLGKTRFVADICRRVHLGLPFPDGTPTAPWDHQYLAMWVAGDRNQGELLTLSESFGFGDRISYSGSKIEPLGGVSLNTPSEFANLYRKAKAARPLFLVVDTAGGSTGHNLARQEEARSFFAPLSDMAARLGMCVIVITHLNATKKVLGKRAEERVRVVIRMSAENREPETPRRVEVIKSNGLYPKPVGMLLGEKGNEYDDKPPPPPEDGPAFGGKGDSEDLSRGPDTKVRRCMDWLETTLAGSPRRVHELRDAAETAGYSAKVLYKAKDALGIIQTDADGKKWWGLKLP